MLWIRNPAAPKNLESGKWKAQDGDWEMKFFINEEGNVHGQNKNDASLKGGKKTYSGFVRDGLFLSFPFSPLFSGLIWFGRKNGSFDDCPKNWTGEPLLGNLF